MKLDCVACNVDQCIEYGSREVVRTPCEEHGRSFAAAREAATRFVSMLQRALPS